MLAELGLLLAISGSPQCVEIEKDTITGADLLAAEPRLAGLSPTAVFGYAPAPGRTRVFSVPELVSIAESNKIGFVSSQEVCFSWPTLTVDAEAAGAVMRQAIPEATLEVIEMSRFPAPKGEVVFTRAGLQRVPSPVMLWKGHVAYGSGRRFDIWARVKVTVKQDRIVASELLRAGSVVQEGQVSVQTIDGPPEEKRYAAALDEVVGRMTRTTIVAGVPIKSADLNVVPEVRRGDMVTVEVLSGAARISIEALASTTGRLGESVELKNQTSGKTFRAKVSGTARATIVFGSSR